MTWQNRRSFLPPRYPADNRRHFKVHEHIVPSVLGTCKGGFVPQSPTRALRVGRDHCLVSSCPFTLHCTAGTIQRSRRQEKEGACCPVNRQKFYYVFCSTFPNPILFPFSLHSITTTSDSHQHHHQHHSPSSIFFFWEALKAIAIFILAPSSASASIDIGHSITTNSLS